METLRNAAICAFALAAVLTDLYSGKIPNKLIAIGLLTAFVYHVSQWGALGIVLYLGGMFLPVLLLGTLFCFRMIGAGDVKELAVLGCFLGAGRFFPCLIVTFFFGGGIALVLMIYRRNFWSRLFYFLEYVRSLGETRQWRPYREEGETGGEFHFTIPIFLSVLCYVGGVY